LHKPYTIEIHKHLTPHTAVIRNVWPIPIF
jgi:hypothetical protein